MAFIVDLLAKIFVSMKPVTINKPLPSNRPLPEVLEFFFAQNTPDSSWAFFLKMFQCWTLKDCKIKAEISDEEVALFFDQLIDLVAAAYIVHQANRVSMNQPEGKRHE